MIVNKKWCSDFSPKGFFEYYSTGKGRVGNRIIKICKNGENNWAQIIKEIIDVDKNRAYGLTVDAKGTGGYFKDIVVTKILGKVSIKDSLFKGSDRYKKLDVVKIGNIETKIAMKAGIIERDELKIAVFEAKLIKASLLSDQDPALIAKENKVVSVEGINGEYILLGSLEEVSMSGNWPKKYGNNE